MADVFLPHDEKAPQRVSGETVSSAGPDADLSVQPPGSPTVRAAQPGETRPRVKLGHG